MCPQNGVRCLAMKKVDLCRKLAECGWFLLRQGGDHEVWSNGVKKTSVPRHREINELTAKGILKLAKENPG